MSKMERKTKDLVEIFDYKSIQFNSIRNYFHFLNVFVFSFF